MLTRLVVDGSFSIINFLAIVAILAILCAVGTLTL
jgi:hypothetical protein